MIHIHDFKKIKYLGRGASGEVYLVKANDETTFAAKISFSIVEPNSENALMLVREVNNLAALRHPAIVQYIGFSEFDFNDERKPVIITEYARNRSLFHIIDDARHSIAHAKWDITQKLIVIYGIAAGMQHCHKHDLIHRDSKPSNILMNDNLFPLIADFGLCKRIHHNLDSISMQSMAGLIGTCSYIPPEVWRSHEYSKAGDVYAFAIIVYEIMINVTPFPFEDFEIKQKVLSGERPHFPYQLPKCYMDLIQRCWADDPKERMTFDDIVKSLKENIEFRQIDLFEENRFLDYCDYIDAAVKSFDNNKKVLDFYQFMVGRGKPVQSISLPPPKKTFTNLFGLFSPTPKIIYPNDKFSLLKSECQHLIERAVTNPNAQFLVGQQSIEGIGGFPKSIEVGIKYLQESISNKCIDSVAYYSQILIE